MTNTPKRQWMDHEKDGQRRRSRKPSTTTATLTLVQAGETKCLAGHSEDGDSVFVLRKQTDTEYTLHQCPIDDAQQALRAILAASDSERGELITAILATVKTPTRKPRRRKAK